MSWRPDETTLLELVKYLFDSQSGADPTARKNAELMLRRAKSSPDLPKYLAFLVVNNVQPSSSTFKADEYVLARSVGALLLKNEIKESFKCWSESNSDYVRSIILQGLQDDIPQIRNHTGSVIAELILRGGIIEWPSALSDLLSMAENKSHNVSPHAQEGAMRALLKICEDDSSSFSVDYNGERPWDFWIPRFVALTECPLQKIRALTLACINHFLTNKAPAVMSDIDTLLTQLFRLSGDSSEEVRKYVCRAFIQLTEISAERMIPHMKGLVDYMIAQQKNENDAELALDAAEFWLCIGEDEKVRPYLGPYLDRIIPLLLTSMVFSQEEIIRLECENERDIQEIDDRECDIKPVFSSHKSSRGVVGSGKSSLADDKDNELSDGELEESDDDDDDVDPEGHWSLRKCSAAALDILATGFREEVFRYTLPYLTENLNHSEWPHREAAVLALGAIAEGCMESVQPHLHFLTQFLLSLLSDPVAMVRQISCWTLGRYLSWSTQLDANGKREYFIPTMEGLLQRMLDSRKRVQEAAASAFVSLVEKAGRLLEEFCVGIVAQFVRCFEVYKDRNIYILYDCVQTLTEHVGRGFRIPEIAQMLMPALLKRWKLVANNSRELFPFFECLTYVVSALGTSFVPYAPVIWERCIGIIHRVTENAWGEGGRGGERETEEELEDGEFLVNCLDLMSSMIQALDAKSRGALLMESRPNLFDLLPFCLKDGAYDVRQSGYALVGDSAIYAFGHLKPHLRGIMEILLKQLDGNEVKSTMACMEIAVINNACWSVGEIVMRAQNGIEEYVGELMEKLGRILFEADLPKSLKENAAIALGRMGYWYREMLAPHLASLAPTFVRIIRQVTWTHEKGHALKGFAKIVLRNPQAMEPILAEFFNMIEEFPDDFMGGWGAGLKEANTEGVVNQNGTTNPGDISHSLNVRLSKDGLADMNNGIMGGGGTGNLESDHGMGDVCGSVEVDGKGGYIGISGGNDVGNGIVQEGVVGIDGKVGVNDDSVHKVLYEMMQEFQRLITNFDGYLNSNLSSEKVAHLKRIYRIQ